jgi:hypothetical protein
MSGFKEISNLGIEASKSYAANASIDNQEMLKNASLIGQQTQQTVNQPILHLSSVALFNIDQRNCPFALFQEPSATSPTVFTNGLIPALTTESLERITLTLHNEEQSLSAGADEQGSDHCKTLKRFFGSFQKLHKIYQSIENDRNRTKKG